MYTPSGQVPRKTPQRRYYSCVSQHSRNVMDASRINVMDAFFPSPPSSASNDSSSFRAPQKKTIHSFFPPRLFPGFLQMQRRESRRIKSYNSVGFRLSCFQLPCCAPALLTIAIGRLSAASCSAFSLPLCLHHVSHVHLRGGGCVVQSRHRKASPNRLHDVSKFLRMQAQDTAYSVSGRIKVVVISGPTAVGKSALAESIAKSLAGK